MTSRGRFSAPTVAACWPGGRRRGRRPSPCPAAGASPANGCSPAAAGTRRGLAHMCQTVKEDGTPFLAPDGKPVDRTMLFPREAATITDVWQVMGLRGTGSDTYEVRDLFVAADHSLARDTDPTGANTARCIASARGTSTPRALPPSRWALRAPHWMRSSHSRGKRHRRWRKPRCATITWCSRESRWPGRRCNRRAPGCIRCCATPGPRRRRRHSHWTPAWRSGSPPPTPSSSQSRWWTPPITRPGQRRSSMPIRSSVASATSTP